MAAVTHIITSQHKNGCNSQCYRCLVTYGGRWEWLWTQNSLNRCICHIRKQTRLPFIVSVFSKKYFDFVITAVFSSSPVYKYESVYNLHFIMNYFLCVCSCICFQMVVVVLTVIRLLLLLKCALWSEFKERSEPVSTCGSNYNSPSFKSSCSGAK